MLPVFISLLKRAHVSVLKRFFIESVVKDRPYCLQAKGLIGLYTQAGNLVGRKKLYIS
jgi:hypothetical protein